MAPENLAHSIVSGRCSPVSISITFHILQSDPPSEMEYASSEASLLTLVPPSDTVPSDDRVFGSKRTLASQSPPVSYTHLTLPTKA